MYISGFSKFVYISWLSALHSEDGVLCHLLVNLHTWLTISSCYGSIHLALGLKGRDGGLSTLCFLSCWFACQQKVPKTFPGPGYLHSPLQGRGSLTISVTRKFVYMANHFILLWLNPCDLRVEREG